MYARGVRPLLISTLAMSTHRSGEQGCPARQGRYRPGERRTDGAPAPPTDLHHAGAPPPSSQAPEHGPDIDARWTDIYEAARPGLLRWLRGRMRDDVEAEDICQEAFIRLLGELRAGRIPDSPAAWVWRVAYNLLISHARHEKVVARAGAERGRTDGEDPVAAIVVARHRFGGIWHALARMSPGERDLILLAAHGSSTERLADELGISPGAARTRLHRARRKLEEATAW